MTQRGEARAWLDQVVADFRAGIVTDACILWPFSLNGGNGGHYPQISIEGRKVRLPRYLFETVAGCRLEEGELIRHVCDEPRCCNVWAHFEVGNHLDNMRDMRTRQRSASGERNGRARLTAEEVRGIRQRTVRYGDVPIIAREYGVSPQAIALVLTGQTWHDVRV